MTEKVRRIRGREEEELKQLVRDRLHRKSFGEENVSFSNCRFKNMRAPSLVAKLMGLEEIPPLGQEGEGSMRNSRKMMVEEKKKHKKLEEIIETIVTKGVLKHSEDLRADRLNYRVNFNDYDSFPPIVVLKAQNLAYLERGVSKDKVFGDNDQQSEETQRIILAVDESQKQLKGLVAMKDEELKVMTYHEEKMVEMWIKPVEEDKPFGDSDESEETQMLKTAVNQSQKQLKKRKGSGELKKMEVHEKKMVEKRITPVQLTFEDQVFYNSVQSEENRKLKSAIGESQKQLKTVVAMKTKKMTIQGKRMVEKKIKLVDMFLDEKVFGDTEESEKPGRLKSADDQSQDHLKGVAAMKEMKGAKELRKMTVTDKKMVERKGAKPLAALLNVNSTTSKSIKQSTRENNSGKSLSFKSISSVKEENISEQRAMREFFSSTKPDDLKSKDRKMNCTQSETCVIARRSNIISPADAITEWAKRASENSPNKEKIKKDPRIINEVMPKAFRTGRYCALSEQSCKISHSKSATKEPFEVKYHLINLLLGSQSFCNQAHGLYGTSTIHQTWCHHQTSNQHKLSTDFLLLDCAEEMIRKGHEMKLSLGQMLRKHTESQSSHQFLIALVEDISSGMKKLASYADEFAFCEESLNNMLAKDLQCNERMLNAIWDDGWDYWIVTDEGDEVVFELEEKLIAGLLVEIVKDLIFYGARRLSWE